jgi:hypothetical protein
MSSCPRRTMLNPRQSELQSCWSLPERLTWHLSGQWTRLPPHPEIHSVHSDSAKFARCAGVFSACASTGSFGSVFPQLFQKLYWNSIRKAPDTSGSFMWTLIGQPLANMLSSVVPQASNK